MPMNPIPAEGFNIGDTAYRVTRWSGWSGTKNVKITRVTVLKRTKTRVTTQGARGELRDAWYQKLGNGTLSLHGVSLWSETFIDLYPANHPDIPELAKRAKEVARRERVTDAAQNLQREVTMENVVAMREALDGWTE